MFGGFGPGPQPNPAQGAVNTVQASNGAGQLIATTNTIDANGLQTAPATTGGYAMAGSGELKWSTPGTATLQNIARNNPGASNVGSQQVVAGSTNATTTLNGAVTNVAVTWVVANAGGMPDEGYYVCESECVKVTNVVANTLTVQRARFGTAAAAHADMSVVSFHRLPVGKNATTSPDFTVLSNGNVGVGYAVPGVPMDVNGEVRTAGATFMLRSATSLTDGSGASAGTLLNAPAAGNPTKWIAYDDNGVTRQIPAW